MRLGGQSAYIWKKKKDFQFTRDTLIITNSLFLSNTSDTKLINKNAFYSTYVSSQNGYMWCVAGFGSICTI